jgi:hypothetical protein
MTASLVRNLKSNFKLLLQRAASLMLAVVIASSLSGCLAATLAPLAMQALGIGIKAGTMMAHGNSKSPDEVENDEETTLADSDFDQNKTHSPTAEGKCNELVLITPAIIEFRTDSSGSTVWRELGLGGSVDAPKWTVVTASQTTAAADTTAAIDSKVTNVTDVPSAKDVSSAGWLPANNLDHMNFSPPLKTSTTPGDDSFLAYAPSRSYSASERDQLASLVLDFGPVAGTFQYKGREYKYATLKELPCFPIPR